MADGPTPTAVDAHPRPDERASVERRAPVGVCSTRPSPSSWTAEAGCDTLRLLFEVDAVEVERSFEVEGWKAGTYGPLVWVEGHPTPEGLASSREVAEAVDRISGALDDALGVRTFRGVSRLDSTATHVFERPHEAQAFFAGMAALDLPRCETTRRGRPVHSVSWTHAKGARKLARVYDKGSEQGGEAFKFGRMEDQRRFPNGGRPSVEALADPGFMRSKFHARFGPIERMVRGVKAASFPVVAQALADEARYGFRDVREAERLAGALVLLHGGAGDAYKRSTFYNRRAELREAGFVVVEDASEAVEVDLGDVLEAALDSPGWGA